MLKTQCWYFDCVDDSFTPLKLISLGRDDAARFINPALFMAFCVSSFLYLGLIFVSKFKCNTVGSTSIDLFQPIDINRSVRMLR